MYLLCLKLSEAFTSHSKVLPKSIAHIVAKFFVHINTNVKSHCKFKTNPLHICDIVVHGCFTTLAISKWPNDLFGRFKTLLGFKAAWPFQNLTDQSYLSFDLQQLL